MISRHSCGGNKFHFYTATEIYPCVIYMECKTRMCTEQYNETVPHSSKKMSWPACCLECIVVILPAASRRAERTEVNDWSSSVLWLKPLTVVRPAGDVHLSLWIRDSSGPCCGSGQCLPWARAAGVGHCPVSRCVPSARYATPRSPSPPVPQTTPPCSWRDTENNRSLDRHLEVLWR